MIEASGYKIKFHGDLTVGVFSQEWDVVGDFFFENEEEEKQFKSKLIEAWEYCSDTPLTVETINRKKI